MILIAKSGSTKTEWCILHGHYVIDHAITEGIDPASQTRREISRAVRLQLPKSFFQKKLDRIYFYGTGCMSEKTNSTVEASLIAQFRTPVEVYSDLHAASRSLFQSTPGIVCILGTCSNSCFYDGSAITKNVKSLGYILGDEGSGSALGRIFLSDCLKGIAPQHLISLFMNTYKTNCEEIMDAVYNQPFPDKYLATFSFFLSEHLNDEYVYNLVSKNIRCFFERNILQYEHQKYPISFTGSIAYNYSGIIRKIANEFQIKIQDIIENPMTGLVKYHMNPIAQYMKELE